jgi:DNA-binding PadR family transcriptional regulator
MARPTPPHPARLLPLSPQVFQILLSLLDAPLHGYALIADVRDRTAGEVKLTASTLYDALARLVDQGLIVELETPPDPGDHDARRRYYQITAAGRDAATLEGGRLERLVASARAKRLLPAGRRGDRR